MSTPVHTILSVQQFLTKIGMAPMPHPPYPPSLALSNLFLFSQKEKVLSGKHFVAVEEVGQETAETLKAMKIDEFKNCFVQWKNILIGVLH